MQGEPRQLRVWPIVVAVVLTLVVLTFIILWTIPQTRCSLQGGTWIGEQQANLTSPNFVPFVPAHCGQNSY